MRMQHVEARELVGADRGIEIVLTTAGLFTYVGWLVVAQEISPSVIGVRLDDFSGLRVTAILHPRNNAHIVPFPPLAVGALVVRRGYDDPESPNYRRPDLGQVERISPTSDGHRAYAVRWEGEHDVRWHTRRMLAPATEEIIDSIRREGARR